MNMKKSKLKCCLLTLSVTAAIVPAAVYADNQTDNLRQQVDDLQNQVDRLENTAAERNTDSSFHMAGMDRSSTPIRIQATPLLTRYWSPPSSTTITKTG